MKRGFLQALGIAVYCFLVGYFMWNIGKVFGKSPSFLGPITLLVLFSTSVLICGLIVFYKPYKLFFAGKKREAIDIVVATTISLVSFVAILFAIVIVSK